MVYKGKRCILEGFSSMEQNLESFGLRLKIGLWKVLRKDEMVRRVEFAQEWLLTGLMKRSTLDR